MDDKPYDVLIIGAGVSGATAAYTLNKLHPKLRILVIEGNNRVGGRTQTVELNCSTPKKRVKLDAGGQWVADTQLVITQLLKELEIETFPQFDTGTKILESDGQQASYDGPIPNMSLLSLCQLQMMLSKMNSNGRKIDTLDPFRRMGLAKKLDGKNVEQMLITDSPFKPLISNTCTGIMNSCIRVVFGLETNQINSLYTSMFVNSGGSMERLTLTEPGCAQEKRVKNGTQQISEKLIISSKCQLSLDTALIQVDQTKNEFVRVVAENRLTGVQKIYKAKWVISSIPINQYARVDFSPELPQYKRNVFKFTQMGNLTKVLVTYKEAFWRRNGFSGEVVSDGSIQSTKLTNNPPQTGPINVVYDATSSCGEPALVAFIGGKPANDWLDRTYEERKAEVVASLIRYFGREAGNYFDYFEKNWSEEKFAGGCPVVNVTASGVMQDYVRATREPFHKVHFCGTESATKWQGYLDGAAESGIRAANEVLFKMNENGDSNANKYEWDKTYYWQCEEVEREREKKRSAFCFFDFGIGLGFSMVLLLMILFYVYVFVLIESKSYLINKRFYVPDNFLD